MNTAELLAQLSTAVHRDAARRRRRQRVALVAATLALLVVGGVGVAGTYDDWWTNNAPAVHSDKLGEVAEENKSVGIDLDLSKKATVARTDDAALVAVATNGGKGFCLSLFVGAKGMGTSCTTVADSEYRTRADDTHWIGYGRILDANAAALDMSGAGLPAHVPLERGGFFLFDIPRDRWQALDGRSGDIAILDGAGNTLRRACVFVGVAPPSRYAGAGALGDAPGECAHMAPIIPSPELDKARQLVTLTLTRPFGILDAGDTIAIWTAPNKGGGTCTFTGLATGVPRNTGGGSCQRETGWVGGDKSILAGAGATLREDEYENLASGFVRPGQGIVAVDLVGADRTIHAAFGHDAFLAELPPSPRAGKVPGPVPGGPYRVVAYDAGGREVASTELRGSLGR